MNIHGVVLFHTTSMAFRAEKSVLRSGLKAKLIPTPRQLSSDCGIALEFEWAMCQQVGDILEQARVKTAGIHCQTDYQKS